MLLDEADWQDIAVRLSLSQRELQLVQFVCAEYNEESIAGRARLKVGGVAEAQVRGGAFDAVGVRRVRRADDARTDGVGQWIEIRRQFGPPGLLLSDSFEDRVRRRAAPIASE